MMKFLLGTVGLLALGIAGPAGAADLPVRTYTKAPAYVAAVFDWSGIYLGANGGWGSSRNCWDVTSLTPGVAMPAAREGCNNASGGVAGGQIGYRIQSGALVYGAEVQGDWAGLRGSHTSLQFPVATDRTNVDAFGTLTGQVGYAWNNALGYLKGGAAVTKDKYNGLLTATGAVIDGAQETRWGGTVGAGVEYGFAPNWSAAVEYDHLFMGTRANTFTTPVIAGFSRVDRISQDVDLVTARINWRFGGPMIGMGLY
jgi:outer membrane immunogenic protein